RPVVLHERGDLAQCEGQLPQRRTEITALPGQVIRHLGELGGELAHLRVVGGQGRYERLQLGDGGEQLLAGSGQRLRQRCHVSDGAVDRVPVAPEVGGGDVERV